MTKRLCRLVGYFLCVVPPVLAILERFPIWAREGGELILSGIAFLLLLVAAIPLRRGLIKLFHRFLSSPSAFGIWGVLWLFGAWFGRIAVAIADIALIGTLSSLLGAIFFRLGRKEAAKDEQ